MENASLVRRTSLGDFVRDLINLIEEQIELAKTDPGLHQNGTVAVCGDAVSVLKRRLKEDEVLQVKCMLVCVDIYNAHWRSEWDALAKASPDEFAIKAEKLLADTQGINFILTHSEQSSD
jgi:hypothetical protein